MASSTFNLVLQGLWATMVGCGGMSVDVVEPQVADHGIRECLNTVHPGEESGVLWRDLAQWAFAQQREIPSSDRITPAQAEAFLDDAATKVAGLQTPADWRSAGRYFQAENLHGLSRPACARADRLETSAP